jgi:shikimate kinase
MRDTEPRAVILMGVSGSGKSTVGASLAQRLECSFVDADDFHPAANVGMMTKEFFDPLAIFSRASLVAEALA